MQRRSDGLAGRRIFCAGWLIIGVFTALATVPARGQTPRTFDGRYPAATVDLTVVYLVPSDRTPLPDWRDRVDYFMKRIAAFHERESGGKSKLKIAVRPRPLVVEASSQMIRGQSPDDTFSNSIAEARKGLGWPGKQNGFPVLLVLSDINWRELDDFHRTRVIDGVPTFEGNVAADGRHFPGAESGGARAVYLPGVGLGFGLVSADGWRVPYSGSDCVVYHEGVGHAIGLPHPEPIDDSVMGTAQYRFWINQTWVNPSQKRALGWVDGRGRPEPLRTAERNADDLFTAFTAVPVPAVPRHIEPVRLALTWPVGARVKEIRVRVQTELTGPWKPCPNNAAGDAPATIPLGTFERPTPVSYRVDATLEDGQTVELWGYFQVKESEKRAKES